MIITANVMVIIFLIIDIGGVAKQMRFIILCANTRFAVIFRTSEAIEATPKTLCPIMYVYARMCSTFMLFITLYGCNNNIMRVVETRNAISRNAAQKGRGLYFIYYCK